MPAARCPHPDCRSLVEVQALLRDQDCPACSRRIRPRPVDHEARLQERRRQAGDRGVPPLGPDSVCLLLEDVRSLWNVGSAFRTADGLGAAHLFLCGITGIPPHPQVHETALGAEEVVSWSYHPHAFEALGILRDRGVPLVALERTPRSRPLHEVRLRRPLCLVLGHEPGGVSPEVLEACDPHVEIPMQGVKESLNVAVVAGIALHWFARGPGASGEAAGKGGA